MFQHKAKSTTRLQLEAMQVGDVLTFRTPESVRAQVIRNELVRSSSILKIEMLRHKDGSRTFTRSA